MSKHDTVPLDEASSWLYFAEAEMPGYTQERAILYALTKANGRWVCGRSFLEAYIPTYAQRVSGLNKDPDIFIESTQCGEWSHHHRGAVHAYRIQPEEAREGSTASHHDPLAEPARLEDGAMVVPGGGAGLEG